MTAGVQGTVFFLGQMDPVCGKPAFAGLQGLQMTGLLRTEDRVVRAGVQAVMLFWLPVQLHTEIVQHVSSGQSVERQCDLDITFILQRKIKVKIIETVLGRGIITPQFRKLHAAHCRKRGALHWPGGKIGTILVGQQIACKGLPLLTVKQRNTPWNRVFGPQTGFQIFGLKLAAVRDRLALSGFQMNILYLA